MGGGKMTTENQIKAREYLILNLMDKIKKIQESIDALQAEIKELKIKEGERDGKMAQETSSD